MSRSLVCPISNAEIPYKGKGRPPVYHPQVSKAVRRAWSAGRPVGINDAGKWAILKA
jgi:hypothetical protein